MHRIEQMEKSDLKQTRKPVSFADRLPTGIKGIIATVTLGIASGCASDHQYRTHPTDQNLRAAESGGWYYSPQKTTERHDPLRPDANLTWTAIGAGIGYLACRALGSTASGGLGCAIVGGLIGSQSYDHAEMERRDFEQLQRQIVRAYRSGISAEPKIIDYNTRHVGLIRKGMIHDTYHIRFKIREVNVNGRVVREYFVHATLKSGVQGNSQPLRIIDPLPFPDEKEFPMK